MSTNLGWAGGDVADGGKDRVEYRVLGSVEACRDDELLDLGAKQRALLALLLVEPNRVISSDRIIDELWGADAGRDRQNALWVSISKLRSTLEPDRTKHSDGSILVTRPPGYMLVAAPDDIDAHRFEELAREGRSMLEVDPGAASLVLSEALALWRGRAFEEYTYESFAAAEIARLEELRLGAVGDRVEADLDLGRHRELIGELESLVRLEPSHERFAASLMLALQRSGRQADALRAFADHRTYLAEELGLDPSPELARLEERILLDDPTLRLTIGDQVPAGLAERSLSVRGYEMREQIGAGITGDVYAAFQPAVGREVVVTVIRPEVADRPDFIRRFEPEARRIARLDHPQLATIYDFWREPGRAFLVMPRFERGNLRDVLYTGPIERSRAVRIVEQVGSALSATHVRGNAHGDVRPENVLFDADDNAYLVDLGGLFDVGEPSEPDREPVSFRPPEQIAGGGPTVATDVFALGRIAELVLAHGETEALLATVFSRACAEMPSDRFDDVDSFIAALAVAVGGPPLDTDVHIPVENPYRGLRAFGESDADWFFGRERLVERLLVRLGAGGQKGRFVVLVGPSGSGKSSVVRAGLLPALRRRAITGSDRWFIVTMTPGRRPFDALAEALESVAVEPPDDLGSRLRTDGIASVAASVIADETAQLVIVVDQLEELFSHASSDEAAEFMSALCVAAADRHSLVKIVATLRADFYDHPLRHPGFGELVRLGSEVITPMNAQELERAITGPAELVGVTYEPGVVSAIVADMAGQSTALPLMQYALTELFERRTNAMITVDTYRELGGLSAALAGRADELYDGLRPGEQATLRQALLRLVALGDGAADTRRRALVSEVTAAAGGDVGPVFDVFARHRLLTFDRDPVTRGPTVEIAHEALLTAWARLRRWIDDAGGDLRAQRRLTEAADEWHARGDDSDFLLTGSRLALYDGWADDPPLRLTDRERRYLRDSRTAADRRSIADRRRVRRLRRLVAGIAVALVIAVVAGGVAVRQRQRAADEATRAEAAAAEAEAQSALAIEQRDRADGETERAEAQSELAIEQRDRADGEAERAAAAATEALAAAEVADLATLVSRSAAAGSNDPTLALLLALEARRRSQTPDTDLAVLDALGGSTLANRVLTRDRLASDCDGSFFLDGSREISNLDGRIVARDPVTGVIVSDLASPAPCVLGAGDAVSGTAVEPNLTRLWTGPTFANEIAVDEPTFPINGGAGWFLALTGLLDIDEPDTVTLRNSTTGAVIGSPITNDLQISQAVDESASVFAIGFARPAAPEGDGRLVIADLETAEVLVQLDTPDGAEVLRFDSTTGNLIAGFLGGRIMVIEPRTGAIVTDMQTRPGGSFSDIAVRADGTFVAVSPSGVIIADSTTGTMTDALTLQDYEDAFIRPDGLVVVVFPDSVVVYDLGGNALVEQTWAVDPDAHVAFADGWAAALDLPGQTTTLVDLHTGERSELTLVEPDGAPFTALVVYPEPDGVWAMSRDYVAARWASGRMVDQLYMGSEDGATAVRSGRTITGARFGDLFAALGARPDGQQEASLVHLSRDGAELLLTVQTTDATAVHPTVDGGLFIVDDLGVVREFGPTGDLIDQFETGGSFLYELALDPTGSTLALASDNGSVHLVDADTGDVDDLGVIGRVVNFGFSGDGEQLALVFLDGTVRLMEVARSGPTGVLWSGSGNGYGEPGWYDASTESLWLNTAGHLVGFPLDPDRWVERACDVVDRDLTPAEWSRLVPGDRPQRPACL